MSLNLDASEFNDQLQPKINRTILNIQAKFNKRRRNSEIYGGPDKENSNYHSNATSSYKQLLDRDDEA